ncbi:MAG: c-type cytochrome [Burkholderiaceae bacterium]|nr:c-type cytochrome [Burkholderiaceae bacterium]
MLAVVAGAARAKKVMKTNRLSPCVGALLLSLALAAPAQNLERGKEINATCAGCHGEFGQGGKRGEYPRLAGQRMAHLVDQLRAFRKRTRINIPMYPYTQERELSDADIEDVSAYLAQVELPTQWPEFKPGDDALTRLTAMEKVMIIPRSPGDTEQGGKLYQKECAACHAKDGMGKGKFPRLVGQYTAYLKKQIDAFVKGDRPHDEVEVKGILNEMKEQELLDVLAYLTLIQSGPAGTATTAGGKP